MATYTSAMYLEEAADYSDLGDEEILARSVREPHLFEILVKKYQDAFIRKAMRILYSQQDAEDVVQDAFAKMYLNAEKFQVQEGAQFSSWGYKIVINTALTKYQQSKRLRERTAPLDPEFYEMLPDLKARASEKYEVYDYVVSVLSKIPDHLAKVLEMHFIEGLSQQEIADQEKTSVGAIKTRVHRAKAAFRAEAENVTSK